MRITRIAVLGAVALGACTSSAPGPSTGAAPAGAPRCCLAPGLHIAERHRVAEIPGRRFTHAELWSALEPVVRSSPALGMREVGRSIQGRPIRAITYGTGPTTVLLWSQMHGDESTATMSLADIVSWLAAPSVADDALRRRIASELTVVMVPMLNPDGAELFQRQNAVGIDVNRDARRLTTPEARTLKSLRDSIRPAFGFNLHDQSARNVAGRGGQQVAIALLAPAADEARTYGPVRSVARQVAAEIAGVLAQEIPGRVARYDDTFEPRAFGDLMQQWGTSTVLIESGAMPDDPEKQRLRAINVAAIVSALDAIATGRHAAANVAAYESLPMNARLPSDVVILGGTLVLPGAQAIRADLAITFEDPVAARVPRVREVGDLSSNAAMDTVDATGLFLHPDPAMLTGDGERRWLRIDAPVSLTIRRGRDPSSERVLTIGADGVR
ncbi:MAG TPA: M14 family zinc carboxypeptidase [Gemmatimonadaceae bacterium]|nr:M14 family zinc carboxypeptidase [Gemmatimonadaceae bacterium]